jgi:hypothetical protein
MGQDDSILFNFSDNILFIYFLYNSISKRTIKYIYFLKSLFYYQYIIIIISSFLGGRITD